MAQNDWQGFLDTIPDDMIVNISEPTRLSDLLTVTKVVESRGEFKRLIQQGGLKTCPAYSDFEWNGSRTWTKVTHDMALEDLPITGILIQRSRRKVLWIQE